jgi:UDP-GlcNAc:undecaprenyl-phosphate GlcNAc-1-phosphate transferase
VLIAAVGVADDLFELGAAPKLVGQIAAAMFPVFAGIAVFSFTLPFFGRVGLDHVLVHNVVILGNVKVGHILTVLGFVAVMNVVNFIDGVDGLAAGVCVIASATFAIIALSLNRTGAGVLAALTAGGSLGFLRRGFPPAASFMGDTGSNLLGYLLAAVAVLGSLKTNAVVALFFPLCILAVPILDSGFVIAKRIKHRRPIYVADRSHFHHRMANIGFSQRRTLVYLYGWALVLAGLALALRFVPYSDNHGHFDAAWTAVMVACGVAAVAASIYLLLALEILKLRLSRFRELVGLGVPVSTPEEVDAGVATELETGTFPAVDPETGEFAAIESVPESERDV